MKYLISILSIFILGIPPTRQAVAQADSDKEPAKVVTVKGEVTLEVDRQTSMAETELLALQLAKEKALADRFGTYIFRGNRMYVETNYRNDEIEETNQFTSTSDTRVKGIWIETLEEKWDTFVDKEKRTWIKCKVKGRARELTEPPIALKAEPLDCPDLKCIEYDFISEESFYLSVQSPLSGYVAVYMVTDQIAQCLLPHEGMPGSYLEVKADVAHILFDEPYAPDYMVYTERDTELNVLYILFSTQPFDKPVLTASNTTYGYHLLPRELALNDFHQWLAGQYITDGRFQVSRIPITVTKL